MSRWFRFASAQVFFPSHFNICLVSTINYIILLKSIHSFRYYASCMWSLNENSFNETKNPSLLWSILFWFHISISEFLKFLWKTFRSFYNVRLAVWNLFILYKLFVSLFQKCLMVQYNHLLYWAFNLTCDWNVLWHYW